MKIGILGGSFDPIHNGHLHMAACAKEACSLDQVWLIPAGHSPNKNEEKMTPAEDRLRMCELAAQKYEWMYTSSIEIDSPERSYTYRTLQKLREQCPHDELFFIMGGDSLDYFDEWCHPEIIASLCKLLVIPRDNFDAELLNRKIQVLQDRFSCEIQIIPCRKYLVSSTELRAHLHIGLQPENDIPGEVLSYIYQKHLYGV